MKAHRPRLVSCPSLLGESVHAQILQRDIANAAKTSAKVLILGETGVGKDLVARCIHATSRRRPGPFVAVNCGAIPDTLLESELFGHLRGSFTGAVSDRPGLLAQAHRGTLFLDEVGEMSWRMQATLLRFLETGEVQRVGARAATGAVDVRVLTATNRDLRRQVADGVFREDLFYRLNVIHIEVPPLRERGDDVMLLLRHFITESALAQGVPEPTVSREASQRLVGYSWPGNIRELRNVAERLVLSERTEINPDDLPFEIRGTAPQHRTTVGLVRQRSTADDWNPSPEGGRIVDEAWSRLLAGGNFWEVVLDAYRTRQLSRRDLRELVDRGLRETGGSYRRMVELFNLDRSEYKRFHAFLYQARCNLPVASYRKGGAALFSQGPNGQDTP